jgi:threonylcarbamoyladenosine tRNA methylthiotransferase MtaB
MPRAAFTTLGCKVNQYETQRILESFEDAGFEVVPFDSEADVYVVNSCSVTSIAESKSRYTIRKATRNNPAAKVVVTGCAAQMAINKGEPLEGADVVVPNPSKLEALDYLEEAFPELVALARDKPRQPSTLIQARTRATLKIQDGCSVMCSYCSIPFTRPGMVSRPATEVLSEARRMAELGYREIVLTGVLIGAYGPDTGSAGPVFEDLLELLIEAVPEVRLRISSIEMRQVTPRLIAMLGDRIVPHLHIPLQAGDSRVLRDMNRPYSQDDYLQLCESLYRQVPDVSITTDIMVGFPTETEECFESTLSVCEKVRYLKIHAFRFSPRFGTPADAFGDPIPVQEKQRRALALAEVSARTGAEHAGRFVGQTMRVLVEGKTTKEGLLEGLTDNYLTVHFAGPLSLQRQFAWVRLEEERNGVLIGEQVSGAPLKELRVIPGSIGSLGGVR